jgi:hypothetical protein
VITENAQHQILSPGAVAIAGAEIVAVDRPEVIASRYRAATTIDARDQIVLPGPSIPTPTRRWSCIVAWPTIWPDGVAADIHLPAEAKTVSPAMVRIGTRLAALEMIGRA